MFLKLLLIHCDCYDLLMIKVMFDHVWSFVRSVTHRCSTLFIPDHAWSSLLISVHRCCRVPTAEFVSSYKTSQSFTGSPVLETKPKQDWIWFRVSSHSIVTTNIFYEKPIFKIYFPTKSIQFNVKKSIYLLNWLNLKNFCFRVHNWLSQNRIQIQALNKRL